MTYYTCREHYPMDDIIESSDDKPCFVCELNALRSRLDELTKENIGYRTKELEYPTHMHPIPVCNAGPATKVGTGICICVREVNRLYSEANDLSSRLDSCKRALDRAVASELQLGELLFEKTGIDPLTIPERVVEKPILPCGTHGSFNVEHVIAPGNNVCVFCGTVVERHDPKPEYACLCGKVFEHPMLRTAHMTECQVHVRTLSE